MDYKITGANKDTGEDVVIILAAPTPSAAEAAAKQMNMFIERIDLVEKVQPPVPVQTTKKVHDAQKSWSPGVAMVLSFFMPGLGQLYKGKMVEGITWFIFTAIGYVLFILPGIVVHVFCVIYAGNDNDEVDQFARYH